MQTACSHCGAQHTLSDAQIGNHPRVQFHCSKCCQTNIVEVARSLNRTQVVSPPPLFARSPGAAGPSANFASARPWCW